MDDSSSHLVGLGSPSLHSHMDTSSDSNHSVPDEHNICAGGAAQHSGDADQEPPQSPVNAHKFAYCGSSHINRYTVSHQSMILTEADNSSSTPVLSCSPVDHLHVSPRESVSRISNTASTVLVPASPSFSGVLVAPASSGEREGDLHSQAVVQPGNNVSHTVTRADAPIYNPLAFQHSNHVMPQICHTRPSLPPLTPFPQMRWFPPELIGGPPRLSIFPYPNIFQSSISFAHRGVSPPSFPLPDSQPPGVTSLMAVSKGLTPGKFGPQLHGSLVSHPDMPRGSINGRIDDVEKEKRASGEALATWTSHKTDTGVLYYYNSVTGESTYKKPVGFFGELNIVTMQSTLTSWEKLEGTDWSMVSANDGKRYYYNAKTKQTSCEMPKDIHASRKGQDVSNLIEHALLSSNACTEKESSLAPLSCPAASTGGRDAALFRPTCGISTSALDLIKKKLQDSTNPVNSSSIPVSVCQSTADSNGTRIEDGLDKGAQVERVKDKLKDFNADVRFPESSSESEDIESGSSREYRIIQFKEMLRDRGVAPFSKWEKELPKIVFDPRFKAVPGHSSRRSLFERYVKTRAEEERKEKRAAHKASVEAFKQLLSEASKDIGITTDYHSFRRKWGNDARFQALDRKEIGTLLNERVHSMKKAVEEKLNARRAAAYAKFLSLLDDRGDIITVNSRWAKVRDGLRSDPRYRCVDHEDREMLYNRRVTELRESEEGAQRAKRADEERERDLRKRKEREEQEMERVRLKARRKEAVALYQALLVETIKDPQASWAESKPKIEKDPQGRAVATSNLDQSDIEKLFREHVRTLRERCANKFRTLLEETITADVAGRKGEDGIPVILSWPAARDLLKVDARYSRTPRKDREALWLQYAEDMRRKLNLPKDVPEKATDPRENQDAR